MIVWCCRRGESRRHYSLGDNAAAERFLGHFRAAEALQRRSRRRRYEISDSENRRQISAAFLSTLAVSTLGRWL